MDIAEWLRGLGLEQYTQAFRDNDIDGGILRGITAEDLKELGISSLGHRRKLLNAITALGGEPPMRDAAQTATIATSAPPSSSSCGRNARPAARSMPSTSKRLRVACAALICSGEPCMARLRGSG